MAFFKCGRCDLYSLGNESHAQVFSGLQCYHTLTLTGLKVGEYAWGISPESRGFSPLLLRTQVNLGMVTDALNASI